MSFTNRAIQTTRDGFDFAPVGLVDNKAMLVDSGFYCWVEGTDSPKSRHTTETSARNEVARLAGLNPGKKVHLMIHKFESVDFAVANNVTWGSSN